MKNWIYVAVLLLSANVAVAQSCKKTCSKKNSYVQTENSIEAILFHDNGVIAQTGTYNAENKLQGKWTSFDRNGNKTAVAFYENGNKVGTWYFYQGDTIKEVTYANFEITSVKTWENTETRIVTN